MTVSVAEEPISNLPLHADVPIAFLVERVLQVTAEHGSLGGFLLPEVAVDSPWWKDYDGIDGEGPAGWQQEFDLTNWGLIGARSGDVRVGGAVVAWRTPGLDMLEGRDDLAVLWDVRVDPAWRRQGVGSALWRAAESWARARGCTALKIETQNVNVPACRFYARVGCTVGAINRDAYPDLPDEVQLLWYRTL